MLEQGLKEQLKQYLEMLEQPVILQASLDDSEHSQEMADFLNEVVALSPQLSLEEVALKRTPSFSLKQANNSIEGVTFAGVPLGHEFTSLVLALLQVGGRAPKIEAEVIERIQQISQPLVFDTYVSLTCHNCPDVVQALNIMSILNANISHTMIDGKMFQSEIDSNNIMAVPTVYLNGEEFASGRITLEELLAKLGVSEDVEQLNERAPYDVLVVGGGVSGATAALYAARKGIRTGVVGENFGGQVLETAEISNVPSIPSIEGPQLAQNLANHLAEYQIEKITNQQAVKLSKKELIEVEFASGAILKSKTIILSTGARWRNLNIPGEQEFKNKGVAYCPHCDGPLFKDKPVAVVGGGNSGVEAAIDLAGIAQHVYLFEFMPELKADQVLQDKLRSLTNVTVYTNAAVQEIKGSEKVTSLIYKDNLDSEIREISVEGVFILIGLMPNTEWLSDTLELNTRGEIIVGSDGQTSLPGVFAAGDCTDSRYKQVVIAMGSGATASLGAFDYLIRQG